MQNVFADTMIREPDIIDEVSGTVAWIGADGAVEVDILLIDSVAALAHNAGWHARNVMPVERGVVLTTFEPDYVHPQFGVISVKGDPERERLNAWQTFRQCVGSRLAWLED